jgi:hypothetical protein
MEDNPHHPKKNIFFLKKVLTSDLVLCDFCIIKKNIIFTLKARTGMHKAQLKLTYY